MKKILLYLSLLLIATGIYANNIVEYEYWIGNDYANKTVKTLTPASKVSIRDEIDLKSQGNAFAIVNFRFKDSNGKYSAVHSDFVYISKSNANNPIDERVVELEYWVDNNYAEKKSIAIDSKNTYFVIPIDLSHLANGQYLLSFRFKSNANYYTAVESYFVFKAGEGAISDTLHKIVAYKYWFGDKESAAKLVKLEKPVVRTNMMFSIDLGNTTDVEDLHFSFQEESGVWSSIETKNFTPEADFEVFNTINTFTFQNTTSFGKTYKWNFGDGSPEVSEVSPTHTYSQPGTYRVNLVAENSKGKDEIGRFVTVNGIREIAAKEASNKGDATLNIFGAGFTKSSKVYLQNAKGEKIDAHYTTTVGFDHLQAGFNLRGKTVGTYDVFVEIAGQMHSVPSAFTIVEGEGVPKPYAFISGRDRILFNRWQTYNLHLGNTGDVDATGVPLILVFSEPVDFEIDLYELELNKNPELLKSPHYNDVKDIPAYFEIDNLFGKEFKGRVYALFVPVIPAKYENSMKFRIKAGANVEMMVWTSDPYFRSPLDKRVSDCKALAALKCAQEGVVNLAIASIPGAGCIHGFYTTYASPVVYGAFEAKPEESYVKREQSWKEKLFSFGNQVLDFSVCALNCAADVIPVSKAVKLGIAVVGTLNDMKSGYLANKECEEKYKKLNQNEKNVRAVSSFDPNEIQGPQGYGDEHYTNRTLPYNYTIFFENLKSATAAAQEVIVRDTLDKTKFDFNTFSFSSVKYGDKVLTPPPGQLEFTIDTKHKTKDDIVVRINGKFDRKTGEVFWQFISLDKKTMDLSEDPDSGFLPPNVNSPEGEGSVQFSIALLDGVQNGDRIENKANIYFDLNDPILTNTYSNTIDETIPSSRLTGIYTTDKPNTYYVKLTSNDAHSGVRSVTVFQKKNSETYIPILETQADGFFVEVEPGNEYYYYGLALDKVGNVEAEKSDYEVSTAKVSVNETVQVEADVVLSPNVASDLTNLSIRLKNPAKVEYNIYSLDGQHKLYKKLGDSFTSYNEQIDLSDLSQGKYLIVFRIGTQNYIKTINVVR